MDPVTLAVSAVGIGMQIYGSSQQADIAKQTSQYNMDIARQEQNINRAKLQQMELEGRRTQMENIRNVQRARAMAESSAVNQGANFGSGLQGGLGQISAQGAWNMEGVNQALMTGRAISGYNDRISADKMQIASLGGDMAEAQGYASLGGSLLKAGPMIGQMSQGFGGFGGSGQYYGGARSAMGDPTGYGGLY